MSESDNILDNTITATTDTDDFNNPCLVLPSVDQSTVMVLEKVDRSLGSLTLNLEEATKLMLSKQDSALDRQMQLVMNNERLLSATIDKQLNIIKNQERLLSESIESQKEMVRRQEKLFSDMTEGLTQVLERSLSRGDSPRQVHAYQDHKTEMLNSQGDIPRLYQHDKEGKRQHNAAEWLGFSTPHRNTNTNCHSSSYSGQALQRNHQTSNGFRQPTSTPIPGPSNKPFQPLLDTINQFESGRSLGSMSTRNDYMPRQKLPVFDGSGDWEGFLLPFNRAAQRYEWGDEERLDRFIECLRGQASKYLCSLPKSVQNDYPKLLKLMSDRFNRKDPPATARKRLEEVRQKGESDDEFAETVRRLVSQAFPSVSIELQEEIAAESFLKGYKNAKIGYEALNKMPKTISEALDVVIQLQHNFRATIGRENVQFQRHSRRVSWQEDLCNIDSEEGSSCENVRSVASPEAKEKTLKEAIQELKALIEHRTAEMRSSQRSSSPRRGCFKCGEYNHFQRDCPTSPLQSPRKSELNEKDTSKKLFKIGSENGKTIRVPVQINGEQTLAVIDTGAEVTVLSEDFVRNRSLEYSGGNKTTTLLNAEGGNKMSAVTDVGVRVDLGRSSIDWKVCIAPIRDEVLIGIDLLMALDAVVLTRQGDLLVRGELVIGNVDSPNKMHVARVSIEKDTTLPPMSETILSGCVDKPDQQLVGVLDPASLKNGAHTGSVLVKMNDRIPVRILNPTPQELKLPAGTHLGKLVEAETEQNNSYEPPSDVEGSQQGQGSVKHVPLHLEKLMENTTKGCSEAETKELKTLLLNYQDVFAKNANDVGCFSKISHQIVTGDASPVRQPVRRTPLGFQEEEEQHLQSLLDSGVVVPSTSDWASPVVLVRKKDGGVRWCIDYRKLNDVTRKDSYQLPNIEECLNTLAGSTIFSTIDLQQGYYQIDVDQADRRKTAFITRYGLFEYTRMPFGLCGAPGTFQRAMECVLKDLQWNMVLIYLDDVIVASRNMQ